MKVALLGDIALIGKYDKSLTDDVNHRVEAVKEIVKDCDYVIGNLESPLTNKKHTLACKGVYLHSNPINVETLKYIGVTHVTLANNHIYDFGKAGAKETLAALEKAGIKYVGLCNKPEVLIKDNQKVFLDGFCCLSANALRYGSKPGDVQTLSYRNVRRFLRFAHQNGGFPIASVHFGIEGVHYPAEEHINMFRKLGEEYAYILHGNHPHAMQGYEEWKESLLIYAQGNLMFDDIPPSDTSIHVTETMRQSEEERKSYISVITVDNNAVLEHRTHLLTDLGTDYLHEEEHIREELQTYARSLQLPMDELQKKRQEEQKISAAGRKKKDLAFILQRLNLKYLGAYINGVRHARHYAKTIERFKSSISEIEPIRVLCVFSTLDRGGAETMCMNIYRHIDRSKVQFDFIKHTSEKCAFDDEILSLGGRIYTAPRYKIYNHIQYVNWWKKHLQNHPEHKLIHGHFFTFSAVYFSVAKKMGRITIGHSHCTPSDTHTFRGRIGDIYISRIDKYSDYRFACSVPAGRWLFGSHEFKVIHNAIETDCFKFSSGTRDEVRKALGVSDKLVIGTVGRIMHQKNPDGIIEIMREVVKKYPNSVLLWIGNGPMRELAKEKIRTYSLQDNITMLGVRGDVNRIMQAMDVFILPSFYEGLGVAAIEAQASGLPCYVSDKVPEEAKITDLCEFMPLNRWNVWCEAICKDHGARRDMQSEIKAAGYDVQDTAEWLCKFYQSLAEKE